VELGLLNGISVNFVEMGYNDTTSTQKVSFKGMKWHTVAQNMGLGRFVAIIMIVGLFPLLSCQEDRETPTPITSTYLPLNLGRYWTYEVIDRRHFGENDFEENRYYLRDRISREFVNEINELVYVVTRERSTSLHSWENEMAYTLTFSRSRIIRTINNERLITLVYPIQLFHQWDANGLNARNSELYTVEEIGQYIVGNRAFGSAAIIRHAEDDDFITLRDIRFEVYAEGVGMIESYFEVFTYCSRSDCLGEQIIQSGRFKQMKLIANGNQ
jgi:hypothetical protein